MKTYTITVNGRAYAVTVEEGAAAAGSYEDGERYRCSGRWYNCQH